MPRPSKGPRLYLYRRPGREAVYLIRDGSHTESTSCGPRDGERAHQALRDYCVRTHRINPKQRDLAQIKIADVLMLYGQDIAPTKPSRETIGYHMKALLPFWGDKTLADVKGSTCRAYTSTRTLGRHGPSLGPSQKKQRPQFVTSSTARRELKTLSAAINHWHRESPLVAVPKVTLPEEGARRERFLERHEAAALLRAARRLGAKHVARFILLGLYTGTRHDALLRLRWDAALTGGYLDLARGIIYRRGSSEKETSKRRPPVRIPSRLVGFLQRWRASDRDSAPGNVIHYHGAPILKMKRAWASVVKEAGLGKDVTPHVLRHTAVSWMLWKGMQPWEVGQIVGADAATIQKVYGHHLIEKEAKRA